MLCYRRGREDGRSSTSSLPPTILTYEAVQEIDLEFTRPVIVLGPLKDRVNDDLMREVHKIQANLDLYNPFQRSLKPAVLNFRPVLK